MQHPQTSDPLATGPAIRPLATRSATIVRVVHRASPLLVAALLVVAIWLLEHELRAFHYRDIRRSLAAIPAGKVGLAMLLTALSYWILTAYDVLALHHLGRALSYRRTALASFVGYAFAHTIGLSVVGGAAPRYRLYSAWRLSVIEIATLIAFTGVTFWLGSLTIAGLTFVLHARAMAAALHLPITATHVVGATCIALVIGYLGVAAVHRTPFAIRGWEFRLPTLAIGLQQVCVAAVDWIVAAAVLYVLLPGDGLVPYGQFVGVFVVAQVAGVSSYVPGGLGVFETIMLFALRRQVPQPALLGALVIFRAVYYLLPLALATVLLATNELLRQREGLGRLRTLFGRWAPEITPRVLAVTTFVGGATLLLSGALPSRHGRLDVLQRLVPLAVMELSHFLGSLVGLGLVILAGGLQRRLDAAYVMASTLLAAGVVLSLLKGFNFEEALVLAIILAALLPCRRYFYRRASIVGERFTPGWSLAVMVVIASSIWFGLFVHRHQEYSRDLWWQFSLFGNAPRFLRASVGVVAGGLFFAVAHLLRPARARPSPPDPRTMERVRGIVAGAPRAAAHLALLGDKSFLFSDDGRAFIMYAVSGRSFIAMGDPIGPAECHAELVWRFRELCDRSDSWPVFYEASATNLPLYLDIGLDPLKFGEEARVPLTSFALEGGSHKQQRHVLRRIERDGGRFEVLPPAAVPDLLPQIRRISDNWLEVKHTREKGFSLGCFEARYLGEVPLAVVRVDETIVAFANIWCSGGQEEISPDLMRYGAAAPQSVMEYMFLRILLWGQQQGFRWCNLGMAPLAGLESRALAPLWHRVGALAYLYGEPFYNFQGLRQFKQKFDPEWRPKYLVCPGGLVVPRVLANVATLVSGGLRGVVGK
ncbi:MAG: bifunctional lysylphosphatidylglycerol flippase/synthetase MprF [Candidatus Binatia bacterium]